MNEIEYITGRDYNECIKKLQSLYGNNFQPIKKRFVNKGGFLGFFQKEVVQVSYVVTEQIPSLFSTPSIRREPEKDFETERDKILGMTKYHPSATQKDKKEEIDASYQKILDEMKSLRKDVSEIKVSGTVDEDPETILKIRTLLEDNEFSPAMVREITDRIKKQFSLTELEDYDTVEKNVLGWIEEKISIDDIEANEQPKIIILVGPTGVGKTTTVAKLAARYAPPSRNSAVQKKVNIITIDNYRIAGIQQIETFGNLMGIPVHCCTNADELTQKVTQIAPESDMILIDTIGFSPKDLSHINKMKSILEIQGLKTTVFLAMMASTKASDMREIMNQYDIFDYDDIIITKLDETGCVGNLISIVSEKEKKFAWYTTGQRVPADIEKASVTKLTGMLRGFTTKQAESEKMFPAE